MNKQFALVWVAGFCLFFGHAKARSTSFFETENEFNSLIFNGLHLLHPTCFGIRPAAESAADSIILGPNPLRICLPADPSVSTFVNFETLILSGTPTGNWHDLDSSGAVGEWPILEFSWAKTGAHRFKYELPTGESAQIELLVSTIPTADAGPDFQLHCHQKKATLGSPDGPVSWSFEWAGPTGLPPVSRPTVAQSGTWFLTVTEGLNGCSATDSVQVFADRGMPKIQGLTTKSPVCPAEKTAFIHLDSVSDGFPPFLQTIDNQPFSQQNHFENLPGGFYRLQIQDALGCEIDSTISLPEPPPLFLFAGNDRTVLLGDSILFLPQANFEIARFSWLGPAVFSENEPAQFTCPKEEGTFIMTAMNENGCETSASFSLKIDRALPVFFPNIMQSDSDQNHVFFPQGPSQNSTRIQRLAVFSRSGDQVFEQKNVRLNDRAAGWNGHFRGKPVLPGVFVWLAELEFSDGTRRQLSGNLTVIR